jgi:hypothetical protein
MVREQKSFAARQAAPKTKTAQGMNLSELTVSIVKTPKASHPSLIALVQLLSRQAAREAVASTRIETNPFKE